MFCKLSKVGGVLFKFSISLLIFLSAYLEITERIVLKYPSKMKDLFGFINVCFVYLHVKACYWTCMFIIVMSC